MYCQTYPQRYLFYACPTHVVFAVASVWNCGENWHIYFRLYDTHRAAKLGHTSLATSINLFIILRNLTGEQDKVLKNYSGEAYGQCAYFIGVIMPDYAAFDEVVRSRGHRQGCNYHTSGISVGAEKMCPFTWTVLCYKGTNTDVLGIFTWLCAYRQSSIPQIFSFVLQNLYGWSEKNDYSNKFQKFFNIN